MRARKASRVRAAAAGLATSFAAHPLLCALLSAQAEVLEHNVSTEAALRYKRAARDRLLGLAALLQRLLPELGTDRSNQAARMIIVLAGALWTPSHPAVLAAIAADPSLAFFHPRFTEALENSLATFIMGLLVEWTDERPLRRK